MELKINTKKVKTQELKPNRWNPKLKIKEDYDVEQQYTEVVKSIKTYGLVEPILVRSKKDGKELGFYEIINGYHRFLACQELKFKDVIVNDLGDINDQQAKKLTIVTEEVKIPIDQVKLSQLLKDMISDEELDKLAEGLPYSKELIESKIELLNFDWNKIDNQEEMPIPEESAENTDENAYAVNLFFNTADDKLLVESLFNLIQKEQKQKTIPDALVLFAKLYGREKK